MNSEEPKKVGMAKTSDPGENASSIPKELMLPWEAKRGFLWGIPTTIWMFLRHPVKAYNAPTKGVNSGSFSYQCIVILLAAILKTLLEIIILSIFDGEKKIFQGWFFSISNLLTLNGMFARLVDNIFYYIELAAKIVFFIITPLSSLLWYFSPERRSAIWDQMYRSARYAFTASMLTVIIEVGPALASVAFSVLVGISLNVSMKFNARVSIFYSIVVFILTIMWAVYLSNDGFRFCY